MQRIDQNRPHRVRGHRPVLGEWQPLAPSANGVAAATGVATLAPAFAQAMPSLAGIVTEYAHELHAELIYDLCSALVREGFGTPDSWKKCGENAKTFAEHAIMSAIGEDRWNLLRRNVEYHLQVSDVTEVEGHDKPLENGNLLVTIECGSAGYLKIGPALEALEQEAEGLGAAFYWELSAHSFEESTRQSGYRAYPAELARSSPPTAPSNRQALSDSSPHRLRARSHAPVYLLSRHLP